MMPYVPLDPRGWRLAMGLRPLELSAWLERDARAPEELALKASLLERSYDVVVATNPEGDEASAELLTEVRANLREFHPGVPSEVRGAEHPVVAASRLVQEDLCVLVKDDTWRLRAACVCFPSRWDLASKIGTTLDEIHSPVPLYEQELARPTNAFFDRLTPGAVVLATQLDPARQPGALSTDERARGAGRVARRVALSSGAPDASSAAR